MDVNVKNTDWFDRALKPGSQRKDWKNLRYFFLWFLLYNIYVRVFAPLHAPGGGVAMPSLSEGNLDLKIGYLMWAYITFDFAVQSVKLCQGKAY